MTAAIAALAGAVLALVAAYLRGRAAAGRDAAARADSDYRASRRRIDDAPLSRSVDDARRWLRDRAGK